MIWLTFATRVATRWLQARDQWLGRVFDGYCDFQSRFAGKMDFQAVFMMGPPGAGKSFVKAKMYLKHTGFHDIDSDKMKESHPDYDPMHPELVHEWSLKAQMAEFNRVLPTGEPFVYDGTAWDPRPVIDRMDVAKAAGYRIFLVYVYVPVEVSLFRNRNRGRFVPEDVILDKAKKIERAFGIIRQQVDKFKVVENYTPQQQDEAEKDMAVYPPPQPRVPPRPGDPDYGAAIKTGRRKPW